MSVTLNPYLSFRDTAREAMEFYKTVFGGELTLNTFGELMGGDQSGSVDPSDVDKIMHGQLDGDNGITLMGADVPKHMDSTPGSDIVNATSISLSGDDDAVLRGYWEKLTDGGEVQQPLVTAPWGDSFGMCADRFGVNWMVNITGSAPA